MKTSENNQPIHVHDCDACTYLGQYEDTDQTVDLYHCTGFKGLYPTVISRYGPRELYSSGLYFVDTIPALAEAKARAKALGLNVT
jgi:hypothetical protein